MLAHEQLINSLGNCHITQVLEICASPEMIPVYSGIVICFKCVITKTLEQQGLELLIVCHEDYRQRQVGECAGTLC